MKLKLFTSQLENENMSQFLYLKGAYWRCFWQWRL